jgi:histone deacetylase 1/2
MMQNARITHDVLCPHAHQQNGSVERKYCHIIEVGLALLANASMPLKYQDEAFLTATFLINLLPTKVLNLECPSEKLLPVKPNYDSLRTFGCACWPNIRPYNHRKLAFRSKRCAFLGYIPMHKGVRCVDISIGRISLSLEMSSLMKTFSRLHLFIPMPMLNSILKSFYYHIILQIVNICMLMIICI